MSLNPATIVLLIICSPIYIIIGGIFAIAIVLGSIVCTLVICGIAIIIVVVAVCIVGIVVICVIIVVIAIPTILVGIVVTLICWLLNSCGLFVLYIVSLCKAKKKLNCCKYYVDNWYCCAGEYGIYSEGGLFDCTSKCSCYKSGGCCSKLYNLTDLNKDPILCEWIIHCINCIICIWGLCGICNCSGMGMGCCLYEDCFGKVNAEP